MSIVHVHLKHHKIFKVQWKINTSNHLLLVQFSLVRSYVLEYVFLANMTATCHQKWNGTRNVNLKSDLVSCSSTMQQEYAIIFALNNIWIHSSYSAHVTCELYYVMQIYRKNSSHFYISSRKANVICWKCVYQHEKIAKENKKFGSYQEHVRIKCWMWLKWSNPNQSVYQENIKLCRSYLVWNHFTSHPIAIASFIRSKTFAFTIFVRA